MVIDGDGYSWRQPDGCHLLNKGRASRPTKATTVSPKPASVPEPSTQLAIALDRVRGFVRRFLVVGLNEANAITLWLAHTYVYEAGYVTPYMHFYSPEPGSGKTTALDVCAVLAKNAIQADGMTEAVLFRLINKTHPTLLLDEVDAVFGKKSDSTEGIRAVLNSGYQRGKKAWRCVPPSHDAQPFDVFCPKALAGLNELPGTLAHRSIPIAMQPPLPTDAHEDFDPEEVGEQAETIRGALEAWSSTADGPLRDPRLKPVKLTELDSRANQIWRILFRVADLAGGEWPANARAAALHLSGGGRRQQDTSGGVQLLAHIRHVFTDEKILCGSLVAALNALEEGPYGGWNGGAGMTTRELGKKLAKYEIVAKTVRVGDQRANGYEREQFEKPWARYVLTNRDTVTTQSPSQERDEAHRDAQPSVTVSGTVSIPHEHGDVTVVTVSDHEMRAEAERLLEKYGKYAT
jgi:hypothetical protein